MRPLPGVAVLVGLLFAAVACTEGEGGSTAATVRSTPPPPSTAARPPPPTEATTVVTFFDGDVGSLGSLDGFAAPPGIFELDLAGLRLPGAPDYVELRRAAPGARWDVVASVGVKCGTAADPDGCREAFDDLRASRGFGSDCPPEYCGYHLAVNSGDDSFVADTQAGLVALFGEIDSVEEALLIAKTKGYEWFDVLDVGAYREVDDGWLLQLVVTTKFCEPITTEAHRIHVGSDGTITKLGEVVRSVSGGCY